MPSHHLRAPFPVNSMYPMSVFSSIFRYIHQLLEDGMCSELRVCCKTGLFPVSLFQDVISRNQIFSLKIFETNDPTICLLWSLRFDAIEAKTQY